LEVDQRSVIVIDYALAPHATSRSAQYNSPSIITLVLELRELLTTECNHLNTYRKQWTNRISYNPKAHRKTKQ